MGHWIFYWNSKFLNRFHRVEGTLFAHGMKRYAVGCHGIKTEYDYSAVQNWIYNITEL